MKTLILLSTFCCIAVSQPALSAGKSNAQNEPYTVAQFKGDCELSGGTPIIDSAFVSCDYPGDKDILCDKGRGGVTNCEQGIVMKQRPTRPTIPRSTGIATTGVFTR